MDASTVTKLNENIDNHLQNAENAFSKLLSIACRINVLYDSHGLKTADIACSNDLMPSVNESNAAIGLKESGNNSEYGAYAKDLYDTHNSETHLILRAEIVQSQPCNTHFDLGEAIVQSGTCDTQFDLEATFLQSETCSKDSHDSPPSDTPSILGAAIVQSGTSVTHFDLEEAIVQFGACSNVNTTVHAVPSDDEVDFVDRDIVSDPVKPFTSVKFAEENICETSSHAMSEIDDTSPWTINIVRNQGCDDTNMIVPTSTDGAKKLCCPYCHKRYANKLYRHLETVHKNEADVKRFCNFSRKSTERKKLIGLITKKGQFEWNSDAKLNGGELQVCRRPNKKFKRTAGDFSACPRCLGSLSGKTLRHHFNTCSNNALKGDGNVKELSRAVEGKIHTNASDDLRNIIFPKMQAAPEVKLIRFDWLLIEFANDLCLNYHPTYQHKMIRSKLRNAGKLLLASKAISAEITDFSSLYNVKHCNVVVEAIRKISRFDLKAKRVGSPGTATTSVTLIKAIGDLLIIEAMKIDDAIQEKNAERFLKVFTKDARLKVNKLAGLTQRELKRHRNEDIPSTEDVNRLATYLDITRDQCFADLADEYTYSKWVLLSQLTLASVLVFNRKRTGEMANILVSEYEKREILADTRDKIVPGDLPESISQLIKSRMQVRGKRDRDVPVMLTHSFDECMELLLSHRKNAGISKKNEFFFALHTETLDMKQVDPCGCIRTFANLCAATNPGSLRGTKLRKHLASICGTMNLTDNQVADVAKYMGHDNQIHRDIYRHNTLQREVGQMATILSAAQGRNVNDTHKNTEGILESRPKSPDGIVEPKSNRKRKIIGESKTNGKRDEDEKENSEPNVNFRENPPVMTKKLKAKITGKLPQPKVTGKPQKPRANAKNIEKKSEDFCEPRATKLPKSKNVDPNKIIRIQKSQKKIENKSHSN